MLTMCITFKNLRTNAIISQSVGSSIIFVKNNGFFWFFFAIRKANLCGSPSLYFGQDSCFFLHFRVAHWAGRFLFERKVVPHPARTIFICTCPYCCFDFRYRFTWVFAMESHWLPPFYSTRIWPFKRVSSCSEFHESVQIRFVIFPEFPPGNNKSAFADFPSLVTIWPRIHFVYKAYNFIIPYLRKKFEYHVILKKRQVRIMETENFSRVRNSSSLAFRKKAGWQNERFFNAFIKSVSVILFGIVSFFLK